jgi:glycine cleavage system aminomethyltransferase T/glycine/D-amino acid oxidase-like deaminating enzyme
MRDRAETVIVGAGIVGASAAYHLAELGARDVIVIDQGPLFETGGSTSHAPGLVFQTNPSRTMCRIAQDSIRLYADLEVDGEPAWYGVGGIEVATTPERLAELRRRQGWARSYGVEGTEQLTPEQTAERIPLLDPSTIVGSYLVPTDGIAKAVRIVTALARRAQEKGVAFEGGVRVTGFETSGGRVRAVETDRGRIECERVLICAGIWGPTVGAMAHVPIPLVAVQHQLVWTDPIDELAGETREVVHPILRHQDFAMYFRHRRDHYGVGSYHHEPIATPQRELRPPGGSMQPSLMSFTPHDFEAAEAEAARLLPALTGRMRPADPSRSLNGMFSFTPDAGSIVGESAATRGVWVCEAVWVTHAGGMGQQVAEWMTAGEPAYDLGEADANRFYAFQTTAPYVMERGKQQYREVYDILHPLQQMAHPRGLRLTPFSERHLELGAEFFTGAGWERPQWFDANKVLSGARWESRTGWAARNWSPAVGAEHLATRERAALFDITPYVKLDVEGPDALAFLERVCANRIDRRIGTVIYTSMLTAGGGIRCDLTVTRGGEDSFMVVTGGGSGMHDLAWLRAQLRGDERVTITNMTDHRFCLGLWGPRARDILASVTDGDVANEAFPYMTMRRLAIGEVPCFAQRISYVGELGWELYGPIEMGARVWDLLWEAGRDHGLIAAGLGAFDSLRLEKGYRLWGQDITPEHDPFEAGLGFAVKMDKDFQGKAALELKRAEGPTARLACMTLDEPTAVVMGKEPVWSDGRVVSYVTSAAYGYSIGRGIVYGYLPVELAGVGTQVEVEYFGERLAATVAAEPLWDRAGERLRASAKEQGKEHAL